MPIHHRFCTVLLVAGLLAALASCSKEPPPPRSQDELFRQQLDLPALYLTAHSGKRVISHIGSLPFQDQETGELCWPALICTNPDCPGRGPNGGPLIFVDPDPAYYINSEGKLAVDERRAVKESKLSGCPECAKHRDPAKETEKERQAYVNWVKPYVLPETAARLKELEAERQRRATFDRQQRMPKPIIKSDGGKKP
jgi:hypothetical protein